MFLQGIALAHESLISALRRVRGDILDPFNAVKGKTLQLKNLQATTDLLRHTIQSVKLVQRLRMLANAGGTGMTPMYKLALLFKMGTIEKPLKAHTAWALWPHRDDHLSLTGAVTPVATARLQSASVWRVNAHGKRTSAKLDLEAIKSSIVTCACRKWGTGH